LDPFAGGSVRGIIANYLGYNYTGVELRQEQVDANRQNALEILPTNKQPNWYVGDSDEVLAQEWNKQFDFIFSCPPYFDLEVYSDLPQDLSNMNYDAFLVKYESIIKKAVSLLKPGAYACFVISNVRDKKGFYRNLVGATVAFFTKAGALFYNDAVLLNSIGTACLRAGKIFDSGKKLTKIHQNILVFKKD
jgi:DNA modification methylase